jgi:Lar family restriction alleviation protein
MSEKLKPCPKCHSKNNVVYCEMSAQGLHYVACLKCGYRIDSTSTKSAAIKSWNARKEAK